MDLELVSDGAAANLTKIKATMGVHGAFGVKQGKEDPHLVEPLFINPFNPPNKIFWIICPSHQVRKYTMYSSVARAESTRRTFIDWAASNFIKLSNNRNMNMHSVIDCTELNCDTTL